MESKERGFIAVVLTVIVVMVTADLDYRCTRGQVVAPARKPPIAFAALMESSSTAEVPFGLKRSLVEERALLIATPGWRQRVGGRNQRNTMRV